MSNSSIWLTYCIKSGATTPEQSGARSDDNEGVLLLYSHLHVHAASQRHNNKDRRTQKDAGMKDAWRKTQEDLFTNIFTFHFIARVRKGCSRFACERVLETEHKLHILTSTTYDRHVVSFLFSWCSTGGLGLTMLDAGFLYGILSASSLDP